MSLYEKYKPFRNYIREFNCVASLADVWQYFLNIIENESLPHNYATGRPFGVGEQLKGIIYPWELDILSREIILNAGSHGCDLKTWTNLSKVVGHIRRLENDALSSGMNKMDVLQEMHRIAHRQFPWQINSTISALMRFAKIYGADALESVVVSKYGMTIKQLVLLGMALGGHFKSRWGLSLGQDYLVLGISRESSDNFFDQITVPLNALRSDLSSQQKYDQDWAYTWNPMIAKPLIRFDPAHMERVICPLPRYLSNRVTTGIFYDLVGDADFSNSFGQAFQSYVGEVAKLFCKSPKFDVWEEQPYYVGDQLMHGVDWVISDSTAHIFIEAKTKRLTQRAKSSAADEFLDADLYVLAQSIAQNYRNIDDAISGKSDWRWNGNPIYPLILTLEEWFVFGPKVRKKLNDYVVQLLVEKGISPVVTEKMPYTIASAQEFEAVVQLVAKLSIIGLFDKKLKAEHRDSMFMGFLLNEFQNEMSQVNWRLFGDEFLHLMPSKAQIGIAAASLQSVR